MNVRTHWRLGAGLVVLALLLTPLLSGCGGGGVSGGTVTGLIRDADTGSGIGNMTVTVAGRSATSQAPTGRFTVTGIEPSGAYQVTIQPGAIFVYPPVPPVVVNVQVGQTTDVGVVWVVDRASLPPAP